MALKLLAPNEAKERAKRTKEAENHRLVEIQMLITSKLRELGEVEQTFDDTLQKQRNQWAAELQEIENTKLSLRKQVEELEERKRIALIPLTEKEEALDTKSSALDVRETELSLQEAELDERSDLLGRRLDEVAEREIQAAKVAQTLSFKEKGIEAQAAHVITNSAALTAAITAATEESTARERVLTLQEAALKAKEGNVIERERKLGEKEGDLIRRELALKDERLALTQAAQELKQKNGTK